MPAYVTNDGAVARGATAEEVVADLHRQSVVQGMAEAELDDWMAATAERTLLQVGRRVRHGTAEEFLADLAEMGLVKLIVVN